MQRRFCYITRLRKREPFERRPGKKCTNLESAIHAWTAATTPLLLVLYYSHTYVFMFKSCQNLDFPQGSLAVGLVLERADFFYRHSLAQSVVHRGARKKKRRILGLPRALGSEIYNLRSAGNLLHFRSNSPLIATLLNGHTRPCHMRLRQYNSSLYNGALRRKLVHGQFQDTIPP